MLFRSTSAAKSAKSPRWWRLPPQRSDAKALQKKARRTFRSAWLCSFIPLEDEAHYSLGRRLRGIFALRIGTGDRMDLVIATIQRAAVLNVGGHTVDSRRREGPDRLCTSAQAFEEGAVRFTERSAEVEPHL